MAQKTPADIPKDARAEIARLASCDSRTVSGYLLGDPVRPLVRARIELALVKLGMGDRVRGKVAG